MFYLQGFVIGWADHYHFDIQLSYKYFHKGRGKLDLGHKLCGMGGPKYAKYPLWKTSRMCDILVECNGSANM